MTDISDAPELEPEDEPEPLLPPVDPTQVEGAEGLPDDVKNGDPIDVVENLE